ncbi:MAG: TAXI family TRAP transporter solute-binding subunit [Synechococcales cyanobacterium CRU_2_2]|nr:TAXI family TRAP transporter solute-binding subunit [Synechococcales cyanobacterium CRU_2_2]
MRSPLHLPACRPAPQSLSLATGSATGYYYRLGKQIKTSTEETVKLDLTVQESNGSIDNLQRLLAGKVDFALVQLDVAQESLEAGQVEAIAVLAREHVHVISRGQAPEGNAPPRELDDLRDRAIAIGTPGSGIRFTADQILAAARLNTPQLLAQANESGFSEALDLLSAQPLESGPPESKQPSAVFYVGRLGASERLRQAFVAEPTLTLLPLSPSLINYLSTQKPGIYQPALIPSGTYGVSPNIPDRDITTLTTPTVLIARPDADPQIVRLVTWSVIATARQYALFYPELQDGEPEQLLRQKLFYIHPSAFQVYEQGDPRLAWVRYWENNSDLQAGIFLLLGTSVLGMLLQHWRRRRSQHLVNRTLQRISEISKTLTNDPQEALREIEELSQDNRLQFIAGSVPDEIYAQVQQKTETFGDQCRSVLDTQRRTLVLDTLLLLDDWQETLQTDPEAALQKLSQIKQQYREMLLSRQVDIQAYMELMELTLMSVMTLAPKQGQ